MTTCRLCDKPKDGKEGYDKDRDVYWVRKTAESQKRYMDLKTGVLDNELFTFLALCAYECACFRKLFPGQVYLSTESLRLIPRNLLMLLILLGNSSRNTVMYCPIMLQLHNVQTLAKCTAALKCSCPNEGHTNEVIKNIKGSIKCQRFDQESKSDGVWCLL